MNQQLIINVLGADQLGILSRISACVNANQCNILDSRHAIYGQDFSLSMIVEGSPSAVTKLEILLSSLCLELDLLSMMKRTSGHHKQNIEQVVQLAFSGLDTIGLLNRVCAFLSEREFSINALRQKTYRTEDGEAVRCKMVLSTPKSTDLAKFDEDIKRLMSEMSLSGKITHTLPQENHEHIESW